MSQENLSLEFPTTSDKPGCTTTEDGQRLAISDLGCWGIFLSMKQKQRRAIVFACKKQVFS